MQLAPLKNSIDDFLHLFFPKICLACEDALCKGEKIICTNCYFNMPLCKYEDALNNPMAKKFWGKINFEGAYAYLNFTRKGRVQSLLHRLKYKGEKEVGVLLGELMANQINEGLDFVPFDAIIPVPLHRKKLIKRGYNQSECIAQGMAGVLNITVETNLIRRIHHSSTQTKKKRFARWENVESIFELLDSSKYEKKHLLLVDDITTTGSTMSACAEQILKIPGAKVSVASLAFAN